MCGASPHTHLALSARKGEGMSRQYFALSPVQVQGSAFVDDYVDHPDFRLVAAFFLGWVFFSGLRHVWFSAFLREMMWTCKAISDRWRGRTEEPVTFTGSLHEETARMHKSSSSSSCVAEMDRAEQRDAPVLLLCMAFMLTSLSSFLSLLTFDPNTGQTTCAFVVAASAVASQIARVCGLLILGLDLRSFLRRPWELHIFWILLGLGTVLSGFTTVIGTGQLNAPLALPSVALCSRKRFLPTSLLSSILNVVLELYIIIRSFSLMQPPRLKLAIVQNARIVQAGSLLLFDLLVVIPNTTSTNLLAEFIPFSIGALGVLAAFNGSFDHTNFALTRLDVHTPRAHHPSRAAPASEDTTHQGDMSERVIRIDKHSFSAGLNQDTEAYASPSHGPQPTRRYSMTPLDGLRDGGIPTRSPQLHGISAQTTMDIASPVVQPEPGNRPRREKILSYSNPIWATLGAQLDDSSSSTSTHSQISIEVTRSPTSTDHTHERDRKVLSASSTILGSDIIRISSSKKGKDRMRIRRSIPPDLPFSATSSVPSAYKRVTHQSWVSGMSTYPTTSEDTSQPGWTLPKGRVQSLRSTSSLSSKSKHRSKSNQSSKSRKSSNSTRSAKNKLADGSPSAPPWIGSSMGPARPSRPYSLARDRVGFVRGPRPPPSAWI